jgi:hypothetical protein
MFKFVIALLLLVGIQDSGVYGDSCTGTTTCSCCCYSGGTTIRASFDDVDEDDTISTSAEPITKPTRTNTPPTQSPTQLTPQTKPPPTQSPTQLTPPTKPPLTQSPSTAAPFSTISSSTGFIARDELDEGEVCIEASDFSAFLDPSTQADVFTQTCCQINVNSMCMIVVGASNLNVAEENILIGDVVSLLEAVGIGIEQGELLDISIGASDEINIVLDPTFQDPDAIRTAQTSLNILAESGGATVSVGGIDVQVQPCAARETDLNGFPADSQGKLIPQLLICTSGNVNAGSGEGALDNCIPRTNDCGESSSKSGKKSKRKCTGKKSKSKKSKSKSKKSKSKKSKGGKQFAIGGMKTAESAALVVGIMFIVSGVATFFVMQRHSSFTPLADVEVESPPIDERKPLLQ